MKILFVRPNKDAWGYKPVGLSLLMAQEKRMGNEVKLFDTTKYQFGAVDSKKWGETMGAFKPVDVPEHYAKLPDTANDDFRSLLLDFDPDEVWVTVMTDEADLAKRLSDIAFIEFDKVVRWGGAHPTVATEDCPSYALVHQGEMMKSTYEITRWDDYPYVDWDEYEHAQFYRPYEGKKYRAGDHMVNWGCPYHCAYCINSTRKSNIGRYSPKRIVAELKYLKEKHNLGFYKFHDEDFGNRSIASLAELGELYAEQVGLPFVSEINPRTVTDTNARILKAMGCVSMSLGVETGNEYLRQGILNRADTTADVVRAIKTLNKVGIRTSSFNMLGIPFETKQTYWDTVELNKRAEVQVPFVHFFYPFKGSQLRQLSIDEGFFDQSTPYHREIPALKFPWLSTEELIEMKQNFIANVRGIQ